MEEEPAVCPRTSFQWEPAPKALCTKPSEEHERGAGFSVGHGRFSTEGHAALVLEWEGCAGRAVLARGTNRKPGPLHITAWPVAPNRRYHARLAAALQKRLCIPGLVRRRAGALISGRQPSATAKAQRARPDTSLILRVSRQAQRRLGQYAARWEPIQAQNQPVDPPLHHAKKGILVDNHHPTLTTAQGERASPSALTPLESSREESFLNAAFLADEASTGTPSSFGPGAGIPRAGPLKISTEALVATTFRKMYSLYRICGLVAGFL